MKNCDFFFCGNQLEQVDGVATNSSFCPLLANMFLSHHETKWLKDCPPEFKPSLYRRYVDNCFLLFCSSVHVIPFLNKLNFKHCNIKLTSQIEGKKSFPFLIFKLIVPVIAFLRRFIVNQVFPIYLHDSPTSLSNNKDSISSLNRCFNFSFMYAIFISELEKLKFKHL